MDRTQLNSKRWLDDIVQTTHITNRDLRTEVIKKSGGAVRKTLMMMHPATTDNEVIAKLRKDFSVIPTLNQVREELRNMMQKPNKPVSVYIYRYVHLHFQSLGSRKTRRLTHLPFRAL